MTATESRPEDLEAILRFQLQGQDIPHQLAHWAAVRPDHTALVWSPRADGGRTWTYQELWDDVRRVSVGLGARGVGLDDRVLIHAENCPETLVAWLACATLGAVGVTTNTKSAPPEIAYFAEHTRAVAAITQPQFAATVASAVSGLRWVAVTADDSGEAATAEVPSECVTFESLFGDLAEWTERPAEPMRAFGIMFTSGTTSRPKAVVHTHANAIWASRTGPRNIDLGPDDVYLVYLPFFHVNAQSWSFFSVLGVGATTVLMPKWSQSRFWPVVAETGVTHISVMPFAIPSLMSPDKPTDHRLRAGVFGFVSDSMQSMFGLDLYGAFGMTETVTHCVTGKPSEHLPDRAIGRVTPGYDILVVDKETGAIAATGEPGELWIRGVRGIHLFLEYDANPDANAAAFHGDWFKTGDMVKMNPDGSVMYLERDKDLLKVGGENVSAKEVEDLVVAHPAVQQAAVVGKTHDFLGEVAVAFVIAAPGDHDHDEVAAAILGSCQENLASFKVPRAVYFVDRFPQGTLDKILKNELRAMADERPPVD